MPSSESPSDGPGPPGSGARIAYVTTAFPWRSETAVIKEIFELDRLGFDIRVISLKRAGYEGIFDPKANRFRDRTWYPSAGFLLASVLRGLLHLLFRPAFRKVLSVTLRGSGRHLPKTLYILAMIPGLSAKLQREEVRYLHANFSSFQGYAAWAIHRLTGIPFGFTVHAHDIFLDHFLIPEKVDAASLVISISDYNVAYMHDHFGVSRSAVEVIHCGVDLAEFSSAPMPQEDPVLVLSVGRLCPMKGFDTLLDACALLREKAVFRCAIVGSGPDLEALTSRMQALNLGDVVEIHTGVEHAALIELYRRCLVYAQPCRVAADGQQDGIPATLMEAMAVGRPVVSTRVSGIPELVGHEREGLLVSPDDPEALAEALGLLITDRDRARRMGTAASVKVREEFDAVRNARLVGERFERLLRESA